MLKLKKIYVIVSPLFYLMILWAAAASKIEEFALCFFGLLFHEFGHIIMTYILKEKISILYLLPFGFSCRLKNQINISKGKMLKILIAGPATSFIVAGVAFFWTKDFAVVNFFIGLINLVPMGELDGGRIFGMIE